MICEATRTHSTLGAVGYDSEPFTFDIVPVNTRNEFNCWVNY